MKLCRLINQTHSSMVVEDIGVRLDGRGSTCTVSFDAAQLSKDLAQKIATHQIIMESVILQPSQQSPLRQPPLDKIPERQIAQIPIQHPPPVDVSALQTEVRSLGGKLDQIMGLIQDGMSSLASKQTQIVVQQVGERISQIQDSIKSDEPMFIPNKIVPDEIQGQIHVKSAEEENIDFESSALALKKAKKSAKK